MYATMHSIGASVMMHKGFTLIEVLFATAIAATISVLLIGLWNQMVQSQIRVERFTDIYGRAALYNAQIQRDISGAFIPLDELQTTGTQQNEQLKKIEHVFVGDATLQQLTFITNNPMPTYWSERVGGPQPAIVRVVYKLVPEKKRANSFVLMRQEGNSLDLKDYTSENSKIRAYELITGVKNVAIDYIAMVEKNKAPEANKTQEQEPEFERVTKKEWQSPVQQGERTEEQKLPPIPHWVIMKVELWDDATFQRSTTFTFIFDILSSLDATTKPVPQKRATTPAQSQPRTLTERIRQPQQRPAVRRDSASATVRRSNTQTVQSDKRVTYQAQTMRRAPTRGKTHEARA